MSDRIETPEACRLTPAGATDRMMMWILTATLLLSIGCDQNSRRIDADQPLPDPPPGFRSQISQSAPQPATPRGRTADPSVGTPPGISGTIEIATELASTIRSTAVLFIIARNPDGDPVAAKRIAAPSFPLSYFLGQESAMFSEEKLEGQVELTVRVAQAGSVDAQGSGDLTGSATGNPVPVGTADVRIIIDTVE